MKKILTILTVFALMFSVARPVYAEKSTREMLEAISNINGSWKPVIGKSFYRIERKGKTIVVLCFYDGNKTDADPEVDDMQAVFIKTKSGYKLVATVFSSIDRVLENINILVP